MKSTGKTVCTLLAGLALSVSVSMSAQPGGNRTYNHAVMLFEKGFYDRARAEFDSIEGSDEMIDGYRVLCALNMQSPNYSILANDYEMKYPYSVLLPKVRMQHALVLFDSQDFVAAAREFSHVSTGDISKRQLPEYLYKRGYCDYMNGFTERATGRFLEVEELPMSHYSAPSRFALGYICYDSRRFDEAVKWFSLAARDPRFKSVSDYYNVDSHFNLKDYDYVVKNGPAVLEGVREERKAHLARVISESYLVMGDAVSAKRLYDEALSGIRNRSRSDMFFAGSVMYAVQDWKSAIEHFSEMPERTDSIGQIANYNLGYCYIRTRNKVEAMNAFKSAAALSFDKSIKEDATFNWAKLAFDLNNDASVFKTYIEKYPVVGNNDKIYSYIAVAALRNRDYAAAVDAFDKIDELNSDMRRNYMKSSFLRASQLISDESYSDAVPFLKSAAYYSGRNSQLNQLSNYWLAESYYRMGEYEKARELYTDLYNNSALDGQGEGDRLPFNLAYCYFKEGDYSNAVKWFDSYLESGCSEYRKGAVLRKADCMFMEKKYSAAAAVYEGVIADYPNVNDVYPIYQAGVCYGLMDKTSKKIEALLPAMKADPASKYYPESLFELGRAYVSANRTSEARDCFGRLMDHPSDSSFFAKGAIEMGMMDRNARKYDDALAWYMQVVDKMPLSIYADDALAAIESVYEIKNEPKEYLAYLDRIGRSGLKTEAQKEKMFFNAAEQLYLAEDYRRALTSLEDYLKQYPEGSGKSNAYFYMGECYRSLGQKERACDCYSMVVDLGSESYLELAMSNFANLSYGLQRYDDAFGGYRSLAEAARIESNRYAARIGMMRSAYRARRFDEAIAAAAIVKADVRSESELVRESDYVTAKSYLQTSRREEAFGIFRELAKQPKTDEGAEACYLLIQDSFDRGMLSDAINATFAFSDESAGSQQYWLARAFIVLGDCYAEQGDMKQAKATFESIAEAYDNKTDGILESVALRLESFKN